MMCSPSGSETYEVGIDPQNALEYNDSVIAIVLEGELTLEQTREDPASSTVANAGMSLPHPLS